MALDDGDKVAFWREFYAARRMELFGLEELGEEYLEMQAQNVKLSLSFVAGFSERLLVRVVKSVAGEDANVTKSEGTWY